MEEKSATTKKLSCAAILILFLITAGSSVLAVDMAGYLMHNGRPMSDIAPKTTPTFFARIYGTTQEITKELVFTYDTRTGRYTISKLPNVKVTLIINFHLRGSTSTLPGNYRGVAYPDIPNLGPKQLAFYNIDEILVMHMTSPWDNDAVTSYLTPPYAVHDSPVQFQWDGLRSADEYRFVVERFRDGSHPGGYGRIDTPVDVRVLSPSYTAPLPDSAPDEHYQAYMEAYNMTTGEVIAYLMVTYKNGYGWDYRFKVMPPHTGPIWYVDPDATGSYRNGSDWEHAFDNLQDALAAASAGHEIWVADGTYKPDAPGGDRSATFNLKTGVEVFGGFAGGEANRAERDWISNPTILSGDLDDNDGPDWSNNDDNSYNVVTSIGNDQYTTLDGFIITSGNATGPHPHARGGGVYSSSSNAVIRNCTVVGNSGYEGGGFAMMGNGRAFLHKCTIMGNDAVSGGGGGLYAQTAGPMMQNCMILGNSSRSRGGGVFALGNNSAVTLTNCVLSGNSTLAYGGALANSGIGGNPNPNPPILTNCTIANNTGDISVGGIHNSAGNDAIVNSCILYDNSGAAATDEMRQIVLSGAAEVIEYSCIQGWTGTLGGPGNIGDNPLFTDPDGLDDILGNEDDNYRLTTESPCIDTGHPGAAYYDPDGSRNDMGAYGGPAADSSIGYGSLPGSGFIFTTVGNIPTSHITEDNTDPAKLIGTANVDPTTAGDFSIHAYKNSPFGHKIWIHGLFGTLDNVHYYQVLKAPYDGVTEPAPGDFEPLTDKFHKMLYWYNTVTMEWEHQSIKIGPHTVHSQPNVYAMTSEGYWSHLDLRMIMDTRQCTDGLYMLRIVGYRNTGSSLVDVTPSNAKDLVIKIDNSRVTARINKVMYDPDSPAYDPINDGEIKECAIIGLETENENLRFDITVSHPNGTLRYWVLDTIAGKNDKRGKIASETYQVSPVSSDLLWFANTQPEYASEDAPPIAAGGLKEWIRCAYQFRLRGYSRITNGYNYIYSAHFSDHYFLDLGGSYGCGRADFDGSGQVDFIDLAEFASHWMETCPVP